MLLGWEPVFPLSKLTDRVGQGLERWLYVPISLSCLSVCLSFHTPILFLPLFPYLCLSPLSLWFSAPLHVSLSLTISLSLSLCPPRSLSVSPLLSLSLCLTLRLSASASPSLPPP